MKGKNSDPLRRLKLFLYALIYLTLQEKKRNTSARKKEKRAKEQCLSRTGRQN